MFALTVDAVSFSYRDDIPVLQNVSFTVGRGEFLSLVGPNGSGKTTLLRLLDRIYIPHAGKVLLGDRNLAGYSRSEIAKRVAFVPQESGILFPFTTLEVVLMGRSPHSRGKLFENAHDRAIARQVMKLTDIEHLVSQPITALSGGERQRVMIARALAQEPEVILLDEPNAHLDLAHQIDTFTLLQRLNIERGLTVISVSHDLNLAATYSHRVAVLVCGSLAAVGTPEEVLTERRIEDAFRTRVVVDAHPTTRRPRVTMVPHPSWQRQSREEKHQ